MNSGPTITIITVSYNSSLYIRDAIEGVLNQTYGNIEYIIGDDCSSDNTWEIINGYDDPRIVKYRNEINLGEYVNRNKAIDMATGKYLIFIDGDDIIYGHAIENFVKFAELYPDVPLVIQKQYVDNLLFPALLYPTQTVVNNYFGKTCLLSSSFALDFYHTETLKKLGNLSLKYITGDEEVRLRIASLYPVLFIPGWLSWPRRTPGQASSRLANGIGMAEMYDFGTDILQKAETIDEATRTDIQNTMKRRLARQIIRNILNRKIKANDRIFKITGARFKDLIPYVNYRSVTKDFLSNHSPGSPYKKYSSKIRKANSGGLPII